MKRPTRDIANGKWHHILPEFGIEPGYLKNKHGPCPVCAGTDRFRWDNKQGTGSFICSYCGSGDGFQLAQLFTGMGFSEVAAKIDTICNNTDIKPSQPAPKKDPRPALKRIGEKLQRLNGKDPVSLYLKGRGLTGIQGYGLRYHPALSYYSEGRIVGCYPAMVAKIENAQGGIESFHLTYLTEEGEKASVPAAKKVMSPIDTITGGAIRLSPAAEHIAITEGIENALAVMVGEGLPCWACVSANGIASFEPPEGVKEVSIFGDRDESFAGQKAAYTLAARLHAKGYKVNDCLSQITGADYLDLLIKSRRAAA
jgi:putative DNA primase/helicase